MKKFFFAIFLVLSLVSFSAAPAQALDLGTSRAGRAAGAAGYDPATSQTTFAATLGAVVRVFLSLLGVIFLVLMVYAGFLWMTARGNEQQIEKAQTIIRGAVIGLIITVGAYSITSFVVPRIIARTTGGGGGVPDAGGASQLCCEWRTGTRPIVPGGEIVSDENFCQARCRDVGANIGTCISRQISEGESCP